MISIRYHLKKIFIIIFYYNGLFWRCLQVCNESCDNAIAAEKDGTDKLSILTDARHGWRKNSRQTDVVCLGSKTKKVLHIEVVTTDNDPVAQRHEKLGTQKIYAKLDSAGVNVAMHCHDNNASITKFVRESRPETVNQIDNWHASKSFEKKILDITKGTRKTHGLLWHVQLEDKATSLRTHLNYSLRDCNNDAENFRARLLNAVEHYKNNHTLCSPQSRCKTDPNYEPSKITITTPEAETILRKAILTSNVYKNAEHYAYNMSTAHVESFNNLLNVYHDKRIGFGHTAYKIRTNLAIIDWNAQRDSNEESRSIKHLFHRVVLAKFVKNSLEV